MSDIREFKCQLCRGIYKTDTTEEEKLQEYQELYNEESLDTQVVSVCDDCYIDVKDFMNKN